MRLDGETRRTEILPSGAFCCPAGAGKQIQPSFCIPAQVLRILNTFSKKKHGRNRDMKATGIVRRIDD